MTLMRAMALAACCALSLPLAAQQAKTPLKPVHAVHIGFGQWVGICYGYCSVELEVSPGEATLLKTADRSDKRKHPDLRVRADLSTKHWKELQQLADHDTLFALPDHVGCPGCVDEEVEFLEVKFSDRSKKLISYNAGSAPKEIKELTDKLRTLENKLGSELPL